MRAGRIFVAMVVVAAGAIVGGSVAAFALKDRIAAAAAARAGNAFHRRLGMTLNVREARFVGPLTLRLEGLRAVTKTGDGEVLVGAVEASVRLGSLLKGRPQLASVRVVAPSIKLDDLGALRGTTARGGGKPSAAVPVRPPEVIVEGGSLRYAGREVALQGVAVRLIPSDEGGWDLSGDASLEGGDVGLCKLDGRITRVGGWRVRTDVSCDRPVTLDLGAAELAVRFQGMSLDVASQGAKLQADLAEAALVYRGVEGDADLLLGDAQVRSAGPGLARLEAQVRPAHGPGRIGLTGLLRADGPEAILEVRVEEFDLAKTPLASVLPFEVQAGVLTADVAVDLLGGLRKADVSGRVGLVNLAVAHPWLAATPVGGLRGELDLDMALDLRSRRVEVFRNVWRIGGLPIEVDGQAELASASAGGAVHLSGEVRSGPHDGATLSQALPPALIPSLVPLELEGTWSAQVRFDIDTASVGDLELEADLDFEELQAVRLGSVRLASVLGRFTQRYLDPETEEERTFPAGPSTPGWIALERIPYILQWGVLVREDGGFYKHEGFSLHHVRGALKRDIQEGRLARGASTVSMQTTKNVFLSLEKTLSRKLQELIITWQLERYFDKPDILELYLNVIEWGPHVYGVRAAARHYFDKRVEDLTPVECLYLTTMVPAPRFYHKDFV